MGRANQRARKGGRDGDSLSENAANPILPVAFVRIDAYTEGYEEDIHILSDKNNVCGYSPTIVANKYGLHQPKCCQIVGKLIGLG